MVVLSQEEAGTPGWTPFAEGNALTTKPNASIALSEGVSGVLCCRRRHCCCSNHLTANLRHPVGRAIHGGSVRVLWSVPLSVTTSMSAHSRPQLGNSALPFLSVSLPSSFYLEYLCLRLFVPRLPSPGHWTYLRAQVTVGKYLALDQPRSLASSRSHFPTPILGRL